MAPWYMQVNNPKFYDKILIGGSVEFGEAYMAGWWDYEALDEFFFRVLYHRVDKRMPIDVYTIFYALQAKVKNPQTKDKSKEVAYKHYDLGNTLFEKMLDPHMMNSCGYWKTTKNLNEAQEAKMDLICRDGLTSQ